MSFDAPTDFSFDPAPGFVMAPLTEAAADDIAKGAPWVDKYAVGRRLYELEQKKASTALLSNSVAGCIAYATISLATLPLTGSTYTIGGDVYQLKAPAAAVTNNTYVAVATDADKDVVGAALAAAINATNVRNQHRSIYKVGGVSAGAARANGSKNVRAVYVASTDLLWIFAADKPGGTLVQGSAPSITLDATATGTPAWSVANLNLSPGAGSQMMSIWRRRHAVSAGDVTATSVKFTVPFYSATYHARLICYTAANEKKGTVKATVDSVALAAGALSGQGLVTLTLAGGGGDLAATDIAYIEVWAPATETVAVPVSEARVLNGRVDLLEGYVTTLQAQVNGRAVSYSMAGVGDQINLADTNATPFVAKATVPALAMAIDDICEWEAEVYVDGTNGTPNYVVKLLLGTAELDSITMTTITTADYVIIRGRGRVTAATTMRMYKGLGETKDTTLAAHTHAAPADVTIQAMTAARDVTCTVTASAGHASNLATIKNLTFRVNKRAA